jgi:hypothetical protein
MRVVSTVFLTEACHLRKKYEEEAEKKKRGECEEKLNR